MDAEMPATSIDEFEIENLMRAAGADLSDSAARARLRMALTTLPHVFGAKARRAPQAARNKGLTKIAVVALRFRNAYAYIDAATRAALYEASWRGASRPPQADEDADEDGLDPQHDIHVILSRLLASAALKPHLMEHFCQQLASFAEAAKAPAKKGRSRNEGADDAVDLLANFVEQHGTIGFSTTEQGRFHRFAQHAVRLATGREYDLLNAIRERGRN